MHPPDAKFEEVGCQIIDEIREDLPDYPNTPPALVKQAAHQEPTSTVGSWRRSLALSAFAVRRLGMLVGILRVLLGLGRMLLALGMIVFAVKIRQPLGKWAMNQMLINVATRKFARSVRLPAGDVPAPAGAGLSKSAASRRFVALSAARMKEWMASDLAGLDLLVIQIDGIHMDEDLILVAAIGVDAKGDKHPLGLAEGATENAATVQALIDNLIERGLDPAVPRLFIIDGAKALSKAIRRTFGPAAAIQRCQIHKARNVMERLPKSLHASVRRVLRQAWELDDADKAEKLLCNLAQRLERDWSGVSGSILEGIDEILTVTRLGLPKELRRSLACTNMIENVMGTVRRVCRNVKRWRSASMAMRWTAAAMQEAAKGFRRLKAHRQLPVLRAALQAHQNKKSSCALARQANAA